MSIEDLFHSAPIKWQDGEKEYAVDERVQVATFNPGENIDEFEQINYIYRHKVNKEAWRIVDEDGNEIIVTGDHSIMVERNGEIIAIKPGELLENDLLVSGVER
jgi:intein/homing endonuclease